MSNAFELPQSLSDWVPGGLLEEYTLNNLLSGETGQGSLENNQVFVEATVFCWKGRQGYVGGGV